MSLLVDEFCDSSDIDLQHVLVVNVLGEEPDDTGLRVVVRRRRMEATGQGLGFCLQMFGKLVFGQAAFLFSGRFLFHCHYTDFLF